MDEMTYLFKVMRTDLGRIPAKGFHGVEVKVGDHLLVKEGMIDELGASLQCGYLKSLGVSHRRDLMWGYYEIIPMTDNRGMNTAKARMKTSRKGVEL